MSGMISLTFNYDWFTNPWPLCICGSAASEWLVSPAFLNLHHLITVWDSPFKPTLLCSTSTMLLLLLCAWNMPSLAGDTGLKHTTPAPRHATCHCAVWGSRLPREAGQAGLGCSTHRWEQVWVSRLGHSTCQWVLGQGAGHVRLGHSTCLPIGALGLEVDLEIKIKMG